MAQEDYLSGSQFGTLAGKWNVYMSLAQVTKTSVTSTGKRIHHTSGGTAIQTKKQYSIEAQHIYVGYNWVAIGAKIAGNPWMLGTSYIQHGHCPQNDQTLLCITRCL